MIINNNYIFNLFLQNIIFFKFPKKKKTIRGNLTPTWPHPSLIYAPDRYGILLCFTLSCVQLDYIYINLIMTAIH